MLSATSTADPATLKERFRTASPFRHLSIDQFLEPSWAEQLLQQFPAFERGNALNENGEPGGKSVVEQIRDLGPAYAELDDMVRSERFLGWLSQATGIPDLLYDPWYFGGGTHENRQGQDLDPHVDFNRHPETRWHRRLNLIVYLNHEWNDAWGGSLELHSNPRSEGNQVKLITPLFNRCVVFETTETSWHGFSAIRLPADRQHLSRRSIALYFYTRHRPREELASTHSTIYVDRPLPDRFIAGHTLDQHDVEELRALLIRRDMHNQRLYRELCQYQAQLAGDAPGVGGSHLRRFLDGCREFVAQRDAPPVERLKRAFQPFANRLPVALRNALRRLYRLLKRTGRPQPRLTAPAPVRDVAAVPGGAPQLAHVDCVLCGAPRSAVSVIGAVPTTHPGPFEVNDYRLLHCRSCDAIRLDPQPTDADLRTLYEDSVQFSDDTYTAPDKVAQMLEYYGHCIDRFELLPRDGACLEIGAGFAWVSRACKQRNAAVRTVAQDVSSECAERCAWVDDYLVGPIDAVPEGRDYDLISLTHVIEHVTDPEATIADLASRLRDRGRIFITAPFRPRGWTPAQGIAPWLSYSYLHVPAHISYLSRSWFENVAARHGLRLTHWDDGQDEGRAFETVLELADGARRR